MIIIHTASRYKDLPIYMRVQRELFEYDSGVYDLSEKIDRLCKEQNKCRDIVTLNEFVVNRFGEMIYRGKISEKDIVIFVYKDGVKKINS